MKEFFTCGCWQDEAEFCRYHEHLAAAEEMMHDDTIQQSFDWAGFCLEEKRYPLE